MENYLPKVAESVIIVDKFIDRRKLPDNANDGNIAGGEWVAGKFGKALAGGSVVSPSHKPNATWAAIKSQ